VLPLESASSYDIFSCIVGCRSLKDLIPNYVVVLCASPHYVFCRENVIVNGMLFYPLDRR